MYRLRSIAGRFKFKETIAATFTAILLILSFPPLDFNFLVWVALAPLLLFCIEEGTSWPRAFLNGWVAGLLFTFFAENWISNSMIQFGNMWIVWAYGITFLFCTVVALFAGAFTLIMFVLVKRFGRWAIALAPIVWPAMEYARGLITGVTWNVLGVSQVSISFMINPARFGGAYLISALIVSVSAIIVLLLKYKDKASIRATVITVLIAASLILISVSMNKDREEQRSSNVADLQVSALGVQPNISPDSTESEEKKLDNIISLTREGLKKSPDSQADLIIWSESPLTVFDDDQAQKKLLSDFVAETGSWLILNTIGKEGGGYFNSVSYVNPFKDGSQLKRYDKIRLVPFGEYVPMSSLLGRYVPVMVGSFTPGTQAVVNNLRLQTKRNLLITSEGSEVASQGIERTTSRIRVGSFICYEAAYQNVVRQFVINGANLLVNVSNDVWFGKTAGPEQHLQHVRMRAIENNRDILRVTNSGISALITSDGQVHNRLPSFTPTTGLWTATTHSQVTFYTRYGDWFAIACLIMTGIALGFSFRFRQK